jgi:5-methylcytosine-specific restriction endonuclease McrA
MGYYDDNVVACCKNCNVAKLDRTQEDFLKWIKRVAVHQQIIT